MEIKLSKKQIVLQIFFAALTVLLINIIIYKAPSDFMNKNYYSAIFIVVFLELFVGLDISLSDSLMGNNIVYFVNTLPFYLLDIVFLLFSPISLFIVLKIVVGQYMIMYIYWYQSFINLQKNGGRIWNILLFVIMIIIIMFCVIRDFNMGDSILITLIGLFIYTNIFIRLRYL